MPEQKSKIIFTRFEPSDAQAIQQIADSSERTLSSVVRLCVKRELPVLQAELEARRLLQSQQARAKAVE